MLNITKNTLTKQIDLSKYKSGKNIMNVEYHKVFKKLLIIFAISLFLILFLPWTQTISSNGFVTTLRPNQRPQTIQSQIPGRIEEWYVQEGDFVKKGDTIMRISEVKSEYFDDKLSERTSNQITAKSASVDAYKGKVNALQGQIIALEQERVLKLEQTQNKLRQAHLKVKTDSIDLEALKIKLQIIQTQYERTIALEKEGLMAVKDVEEYNNKLQETSAKFISQENKYLTSKNEVINYQLEISRIKANYADKLAKVNSDIFSAQSAGLDTEAQVSKLETDFANYEKRGSLKFVTAPQDGYITKAIKSGIGESFKEGDELVGIMPAKFEFAVEMFVRPIDLPLIHLNEKVRVQFDGWPAIVFSGWPNASYGTYGARVVAIENFISENGKYRVLIAPDPETEEWPKLLRVGSGAQTIALLEDVPIWYEIWRQINSFPPNFYQPKEGTSMKKNEKK